MNESLMKHGAFGWNELMTTDATAARSFYSALFGWETEDYPGGNGYVMVKVGGEAVGGMMTLPPECAGMPPAWGVYVTVDDVDATARQVETLGGKSYVPGRYSRHRPLLRAARPAGATLCAITYRQP
ncbi:MAG: VOC family protein [Candidatus Competibacteraceae bacterium]|nr:VOC family protein [Candidatus Competibacteraceae bacterium]